MDEPFLGPRGGHRSNDADSEASDEIADVCRHSNSDIRLKLCATCGSTIDPTHRRPAAVSSAGTPVVYLFCTPACRDEWLAADTEK